MLPRLITSFLCISKERTKLTGLIIEFFVNNRLTKSLPILIIRNRLREKKKYILID